MSRWRRVFASNTFGFSIGLDFHLLNSELYILFPLGCQNKCTKWGVKVKVASICSSTFQTLIFVLLLRFIGDCGSCGMVTEFDG